MASSVVEMDYEVVEGVAKGFDTAHEMLQAISQALKVAIESLRAASFVSFGTTAALEQTLEFFKKIADNLMKLCVEFADKLRKAIGDHKRGDYKAGAYFEKGITLN